MLDQDRNQVELHAMKWVWLPGTGAEVLLHGRNGALTIERRGDGSWPLPAECYVRHANVRIINTRYGDGRS